MELHKNLQMFPDVYNSDTLLINSDYSLNCNYGEISKVFIQNCAKHTHGVTDPNLSVAAWRNAVIINSLLNKPIYKTEMIQPIMDRTGMELHKNVRLSLKDCDSIAATVE